MKESTRKALQAWLFPIEGQPCVAPTDEQIQEAFEAWKASGFDNSDEIYATMVWNNYFTTEGVVK